MERSDQLLTDIRKQLDDSEDTRLSPFATPSRKGVRRKTETMIETGYRQTFSVDADRILNSLAYTRYIDKTQVFSLVKNDHITHRVLHVQLVSKIARTIGRFLKLNEDLIEAISLGHDIGHAPFGHDGERFLSDLCMTYLNEQFHHNAQSVHFLEHVEKKGTGWNLSLQTLDGILCHNGEIHDQYLKPVTGKTFQSMTTDIKNLKQGKIKYLTPMTLEGCVVRMADTIAYVGRDIEDAIRLDLIKRKELPDSCKTTLGDTNGTIVYHLVTDLLKTSHGENHIGFSDKTSAAFKTIRDFNMERIYMNTQLKKFNSTIRDLFKVMFETYLNDIESENRSSDIFVHFLKDMSATYMNTHQHEEIVRDFISGMTDKYFLRLCPRNVLTESMIA
ncbi:MAG: HD domain-containing protein [Proteobacteria bacterium]|nr:HD domain-containing protein [Pseudomonadota bacterium]